MKRIKVLLLLCLCVLTPLELVAQDRKVIVNNFERSNSSILSRTDPVKDNAGNYCAVIRFWYSGTDYVFEPNLGFLKIVELPGETRLWVPSGTKKMTIRHKYDKPLRRYQIPLKIESRTDYDVDVAIVESSDEFSKQIDLERNVKLAKTNFFYISPGLNITSILGPSLILGASLDRHNVEIGGVFGLNKTDDLYPEYFDGTCPYQYKAIRGQIRYGYEFSPSKYIDIVPLVGGNFNFINGTMTHHLPNFRDDLQDGFSLSLSGGVRFIAKWSTSQNAVRFHITPEWTVCIKQNPDCALLSWYNPQILKWVRGFNLYAGIMIYL